MDAYYLDFETYGKGQSPDPSTDRIITVQFQKMELETGNALGELTILKEWESSEAEIVCSFLKHFLSQNPWNFIPVGFNLNFEYHFLRTKAAELCGTKISERYLYYERPYIDLKSTVVLMNGGVFRGAKLSKFSGKEQNGNVIAGYYEEEDYASIEKYIVDEADAFLRFYSDLLLILPFTGKMLLKLKNRQINHNMREI